MKFIDLLETKRTVGEVKKIIAKANLTILDPQFFSVEKRKHFGGDSIIVRHSDGRTKDLNDIKAVQDILTKTYKTVEINKNHITIIN